LAGGVRTKPNAAGPNDDKFGLEVVVREEFKSY
jgi:hypothetical protein